MYSSPTSPVVPGDIKPLFCPSCDGWVTHIVFGGGPLLVRHHNKGRIGGRWVKCQKMWVVTTDGDQVELELVDRGSDPKAALQAAAHKWLAERVGLVNTF